MILRSVEHGLRLLLKNRGFASRRIRSSAGMIHVYDGGGRGTLPPIVLLHGIGANATGFAELMVRLSRHTRRIVAPDAPGHGFSVGHPEALHYQMAFDAVIETLDRVLEEPAIVVGNSMGGAVALRIAQHRPERVLGMVLLSPAGTPMSAVEIAALRARFTFASSAEALRFVRGLYHRAPWYTRLIARDVRAIFASPAINGILGSVTPGDGAMPEALASMSMPILFVWGKSETLLPPAHLEYYRRHLPPQAQILEPEDFGHCPHLDRARAVAELIVKFGRSVEAGGAQLASQPARAVPPPAPPAPVAPGSPGAVLAE